MAIRPGVEDGGMPMDPVCGMALTADEAVATLRRGGARYYFCSEECRRRFAANPGVYTE